ncbi:MAG: IgGFc-binding protein [Candidatus Kapaibacterium sp.]
MSIILSKKYCALVLAMILIISVSEKSYSQESDTTSARLTLNNPEGTEFWLCFMKNYREQRKNNSGNIDLELFLTGNEDTEVVIEIKSIGYRRSIMLNAGTVQNIVLDSKAEIRSSEIVEQKHAVHIKSEKPISVYGLNSRFQTTDTYMAIPKRVLGTEYRVVGYSVSSTELMSQLAVVGTEDNTEVEITPTVLTQSGKKPGQPYTIHLNKGDVYQLQAAYDPREQRLSDLTGTFVKSNKKISVFSGHQCAYVPINVQACNHLVEQIPPISSWGKHYYIGPLRDRSAYNYRVLAHKNDTRVFVDNRLSIILKEGQFAEGISDTTLQITTDKPVLVTQYSQGFSNGDSIGDPMMLLISPTQQFLKKYRFATPIKGDWKHYINVVVPTEYIETMRLNGSPVNTSTFTEIGLSRYSIGYIQIPYGTHVITCARPFGLYSYGFGFGDDAYDAYGTMGGQSFKEYVPLPDTIPPVAELESGNGSKTVIVRDDGINDTGLRDVNIILNENFKVRYDTLYTGAPQHRILAEAINKTKYGRLVFTATDIEMNTSEYTLCYTENEDHTAYEYYLNEGTEIDCSPDPGYFVGAYGMITFMNHFADFSSSGNVSAPGVFEEASGTGGYGGFIFGREIHSGIIVSARLSFENRPGLISAPDSITKRIRDTATNELIPFQEATDLSLNGLFAGLGFAAEIEFNENIYGLLGLQFSMPLSKSIDYKRRIIMPDEYVYENGEREITRPEHPSEMESLNFLSLSGFAGAGFKLPITNSISVYSELMYNAGFTSIISPGSWSVSSFSIMIGGRYSFHIQ